MQIYNNVLVSILLNISLQNDETTNSKIYTLIITRRYKKLLFMNDG